MTRLLLLSLLLVSMLAGCRREAEAPATAPPPVATPAPVDVAQVEFPTLDIATIDGGRWNLAERRGRWVVVNFWATWCAPCLKEMPELSALDAMREHIEVVGLAYEENTPEQLQAFLEDHPVVYPIALVDVYEPPADFETPRGLPMTYLIDPEGRVARRFLGPVTAAEIEAAIASP